MSSSKCDDFSYTESGGFFRSDSGEKSPNSGTSLLVEEFDEKYSNCVGQRPEKCTFITSFFHIYNEEYDERKTIPWRMDRFREIAATGIHIGVYTCPRLRNDVETLVAEFPDNVRLMKVMELSETVIAGMVSKQDAKLPRIRNEPKDTVDYLTIINSKTEFMTHAIEENPWNSTHFAWIDFNISHVFFDRERSLSFLQWLGTRDFCENNCFVIPGCWDKWSGEHIDQITDIIHWRFCGGFFLGDAASIQRFHALYLEHFPRFLAAHGTLVWEVNFWAWLEAETDWTTVYEGGHGYKAWYKADHNDTIICDMWARTVSRRVLDMPGISTCVYEYPAIDGYHPSSASYLFHEGKHWLNTRYVNYWYYPDGWYMFYDGTNIIRSKNVLSELDQETMLPLNYTEMSETIDLPAHEMYSRGIEDVRLYGYDGRMKYIATTVGYHSTGGNRMMIGEYCIETGNLAESKVIEPPTDTFVEKNWVPLVLNNQASEYHGRELFIYGWSPFCVGEIRDGKLEIIYQSDKTRLAPFFHKMKGSANLVDTGEVLVGVVHFSEELRPRHYFHMLVELDRTTLEPLRYSDPFYFSSVSIEFCIGFSLMSYGHLTTKDEVPRTVGDRPGWMRLQRIYPLETPLVRDTFGVSHLTSLRDVEGSPPLWSCLRNDEYWFWISRMDRDPMLVRVPVGNFDESSWRTF